MIRSLIRQHVSRFRLEIALFWLLSIATSLALVLDAPAVVRLCLARLEIVGLAWLSVRLLLAEEGFQTCGGWQSRPLSPLAVFSAPVLLLAGVLLVPLGLRALLLQRLLGLDSAGWKLLLNQVWWPQAVRWLLCACGVKAFGLVILRGLSGRGRAVAWTTLAIVLLILTSIAWRSVRMDRSNYGNSGGEGGPAHLAQGIMRQLPDASDFIGAWYDRVSGTDEVPAAREILRVPLGNGGSIANGRLLDSEARIEGVRVQTRIRLLLVDEAKLRRLAKSCAILRYADGTCATVRDHVNIHNPNSGPLLAANEFGFAGSFISPLSLPEFDGHLAPLLAGAELIFFEADLSRDALPLDSWRRFDMSHDSSRPITLPPVPAANDVAALHAVTSLVARKLNEDVLDWTNRQKLGSFARQLPAGALPALMASGPWSDTTWNEFVRPFLIQHARDEDRPALLALFDRDPRVGEVLLARRWDTEALPLLRRHAKERLPMPSVCIMALAKLQDPSLAPDLAVLAQSLPSGTDKLAPLLRWHPSFDWPAFVAKGWKLRKYGSYEKEGWLYAHWAAELGDASAFQRLAEEAAVGKKWEREQIATLVSDAPADVIGYLRENFERLRYDPASGKWRR